MWLIGGIGDIQRPKESGGQTKKEKKETGRDGDKEEIDTDTEG